MSDKSAAELLNPNAVEIFFGGKKRLILFNQNAVRNLENIMGMAISDCPRAGIRFLHNALFIGLVTAAGENKSTWLKKLTLDKIGNILDEMSKTNKDVMPELLDLIDKAFKLAFGDDEEEEDLDDKKAPEMAPSKTGDDGGGKA